MFEKKEVFEKKWEVFEKSREGFEKKWKVFEKTNEKYSDWNKNEKCLKKNEKR